MRATFVLVLLFFSACTSPPKLVKFSHLHGLAYRFSDNSNRMLKIDFLTDTTLVVTNRSSMSHSYHLVNFETKYLYKRNEIGTVLIQRRTASDKPLQKSKSYRRPYDNRSYLMDNNAYQYIFPDIEGDTLRFSSAFDKLQVREFSFEKVK
jgi:hypothetical protein